MKKGIFTSAIISALLGGSVITGCSMDYGTAKAPELLSNAFSSFSNTVDRAGLGLQTRQFVSTGRTLVKVEYKNKKNIADFEKKGMDVWSINHQYVMGNVPSDLLNEIKSSYQYQMISPREGMSVKNSFDKGYHTYDSMTAELKDFVTKYPNLASMTDIGDGWEKTQGKANRDIWALKITGKTSGTKPGVLFMGNHHAREIVTVEIPMLLAKHLLENYGKDQEVTKLVDTREIWIIPMVNPDGHARAEKGADQRKNANGVDLNRNYGYKWGTTGISNSPSADTYCGKKAFSEPETQAIRDFETAHSNLKASISWHSFSNVVMWPWSYDNDIAPDSAKLSEMGKKMASFSGYEPEQSSEMYPASGDTDDWSYSQHKIFGFTVEIGNWNDGFDPSYSSMPKFWKENLPMCMYLIKTAGEL